MVALGEGAARVLVGRDLSSGGMRIAPCPAVRVGDVLRVALHCESTHEPMIVIADALRDDGEDGLVLGFRELAPGQRRRLEAFVAGTATVHAGSDGEDDEGEAEAGPLVVGEILLDPTIEDAAAGMPPSSSPRSVVDAGEPVEDTG